MPDKNLTVVGYAAGASLAAITLFYVFGPTFFIDGDESSGGFFDGKKRTITGLSNPANDCFINSVLQALAGLGDLRLYLIKEIHRRELDGAEIFESLPLVLRKGDRPARIQDLQRGLVTRALKDMLDALNERPIYKKTITAKPLIESLERAYATRISRNQQDAQEFLQIVLERLDDEYKAGEKARSRMAEVAEEGSKNDDENTSLRHESSSDAIVANGEGFPFEGQLESQIQCMYCGFKTKPSISTFVSLTLNVPQGNSTTLDRCFDILLKTEEIEDYRCDRCRLKHALEWKQSRLAKANNEEQQKKIQQDITKLERAIKDDPEVVPEGVELPEASQAPKRNIKKYMRITRFPKIIAIHLSRSVYDARSYSTKNMAKVNYTERLRLGGILNEHWYRLLGVVCHKGNHNSGHYESFRRNHMYPPFSTPDAWGAYAANSKANSIAPSPTVGARSSDDSPTTSESTPSESSTALSNAMSRQNTATTSKEDGSTPLEKTNTSRSFKRTITQGSRPQIQSHASSTKPRKRKKQDRWWRISDDKIKEAKTSDVLGMQREVYLLFYELERSEAIADD
ncbi:hypothetical protein PMZ80_010805 [Knufia obscura]|uniref:Ubiquitin carboxyl-terminal hydrolase n=2 Tax=Knufia TaxID=430999 RepID=A0AAN8E7H6_9EURO|nr:hypothetical protein PMZ80_010805 [Knufia obscura]KAK5947849.1 hypothetical protein OHC33_011114 [Knufia fluminis]